MTADQDDLVGALVDLAEILDRFNHARRREAEQRTGQPQLSGVEVSVTAALLRQPWQTLDELAETTEEPRTAVLHAVQSLLHRQVLVGEGDVGAGRRYRATPTALTLRSRTRQRAAQQLRYSLAAITAEDLRRLESARGALEALAAALGHREVHTSYVVELGPRAGEEPGGRGQRAADG